jgi:hypothetical protein
MKKTIKLSAGLVLQFQAGEVEAIKEGNTIYLPAFEDLSSPKEELTSKLTQKPAQEEIKASIVKEAVKQTKETATMEYLDEEEGEELTLEALQEMSLTDLKQIAKDYGVNIDEIAKKQSVQRWSSKTLATALYDALQNLEDGIEYEEEEEEESPKNPNSAKKESASAFNLKDIVQAFWDDEVDEDDTYLTLVKMYGKDKVEVISEWFESEFKSAAAALRALENALHGEEDEEDAEEDAEEATPIAKAEWVKLKPGTLVSVQWHSQDDDWFEGEVIAHDDERAEECEVRIRKADVLIAYEDGTVAPLDSEDNEVVVN